MERDWFALVSNEFRSDMYMRSTESAKIISDVTASLEADKIDENAEQIVVYNDNVIRLDKSVQAAERDGTVTISSEDVALTKDDIFVAYIDGHEQIFKADSVSMNGGEIIVKTTDVSLEEAFEEINVQGSGTAADETAVANTYSENSYYLPEYKYLDKAAFNDVDLSKSIDLGGGAKLDLSGTLSNIVADYKLEWAKTPLLSDVQSFYLNVDADADFTAKISGSYTGTKSKEVRIKTLPPVWIGATGLSVDIGVFATVSVSGEVSLTYSCDLGGGVSYTKSGGLRTVKSFHSKGFSTEAHASAKAALKAELEGRYLGIELANLYAQCGAEGKFDSKTRDDGTVCDTLRAWLFADIGASALPSLQKYIPVNLSHTWHIISESNSPIKLVKHWENGTLVNSCKYEKLGSSSSSKGTHYSNYADYTKYGSNFEGLIDTTNSADSKSDGSSTKWSENITLTEDTVIPGNLDMSANVNLNGHTLTIHGDLIQTVGKMNINSGTLNVNSDYKIQTISQTGVTSSSSGTLFMENVADTVNVGGDFVMQSGEKYHSYENDLTAGTMTIGGDFYQYNGNDYNFESYGNHVVIIKGAGTHNLHFDSSSSYFTNLQTEDGAAINFTGKFRGFKLLQDIVINGNTKLTSDTLNLNGYTLIINGDFSVSSTLNINKGHLIVNGNLTDNYDINCVSGTVDVKQDMTQNDDVNLNGGTINVAGNLRQTAGEMDINGGTLNVDGDYKIQTISAVGITLDSSGRLVMENNSDAVNVGGDFVMQSSKYCYYTYDYNRFTAGTMTIGGDFYQYNGDSENFQPSSNHIVILNGDEPQKVYFESEDSYINILVLMQPKSNYTFTPENCYKTLIEKAPAVTVGDTNGDGKINVADLVLLQEYIVRKTDNISMAADLNNDGIINAFDAAALRRMLLNS